MPKKLFPVIRFHRKFPFHKNIINKYHKYHLNCKYENYHNWQKILLKPTSRATVKNYPPYDRSMTR